MSNIDTISIPLYHGTDKKVLDYSRDERIEIQALCVSISDHAYQLLSEDGLSVFSPSKYKAKRLSEIGEYWTHVINAFQKYDSRKNGSKLYEYGSLYLTGDKGKAKWYARGAYVLGEQGKTAYWLYTAASRIWDLKACDPYMSRRFERFEELIAKPRIPVILTFNDIPKNDLLSEKGEEIDWKTLGYLLTDLNYRLKNDSTTTIFDGKIEYLL